MLVLKFFQVFSMLVFIFFIFCWHKISCCFKNSSMQSLKSSIFVSSTCQFVLPINVSTCLFILCYHCQSIVSVAISLILVTNLLFQLQISKILSPICRDFLNLCHQSRVSSRWMIHREEWVLNIVIQHQYPVQMSTYKKDNKFQTINKRTYKK